MFRSKLSFKRVISILLIISTLALIIMPILNINVSYAAQTRTIKSINEFPESYRQALTTLKNKYQNWTFTYFDTGLDWNTVIDAEVKKIEGKAASSQRNVLENRTGEWTCGCCDNSGRWKHASRKAIEYYMDPRNFFNESQIFQFEALSYVPSAQTEAGVLQILAGTFMEGSDNVTYKDNTGTVQTINKSYAKIIMEAASEYNVNPYHIASRIKQEVTKANKGRSDSVTGEVREHLGLYNFFNIQATEPNAIINGLTYAGKTITTYLLPWTNPELAIKGGTIYVAENYIAAGQDSIYLQKYDVAETGGLYTHQYMQNIAAPPSEGNKVFTAYSGLGIVNSPINFIIPVYSNMPASPCPIPSDLASVKLTDTEAVLEPNATVTSLKNSYPTATITGENGDSIGTGASVTISGRTYTVIKLGDSNGDGRSTASDYVLIKNHIMTPNTNSLSGVFAKGADVNRDSKISASDYVLIKNYIMTGVGITL